ncbi:hypothetical protein [Chlamydia gallinacea]|uniref:hypothetical protein n=1 Tax=Chlamydia gallinacea TaxID=1457153 RepID=UPI00255CEEF6|nr:hypothetical protein [Chlamydia gallinacea]
MDIRRRGNQHCFYIEKTDSLMRNSYSQDPNNFKKGAELKKFLDIKKQIITSAREFQHEKQVIEHCPNKIQWLPYKNEDLEEAKELFTTLKSMDSRLAQLFFYAPNCRMDSCSFIEVIREYEKSFALGGILLLYGSLEQQSKYIQDFNQLNALPLLTGSSVSHSLFCYLSYRDLSLIDCTDFYDLGRELGKLVRTYGVFISLILQENISIDLLNYSNLVQGLQSSGNIQGKLCQFDVTSTIITTPSPIALRYSLANTIRSLAINVDFSSLKFIGCSIFTRPENTVKFLNYGVECFIFSNLKELKMGIKTLTSLISSGRISPTIVNKNIVKILMLKRRLKKYILNY